MTHKNVGKKRAQRTSHSDSVNLTIISIIKEKLDIMRAKEKQRTKRVGRDGAKLGRSFYFIDNNVNCVRYRYVGEERTYVVRHKHSVGGGESGQLVHEGK